jgi:hypothetical protein
LRYNSFGNFTRASVAIIHLIIEQISYRLDNANRDRLHGKSTPDSKVDTHQLADKVCQIYIKERQN